MCQIGSVFDRVGVDQKVGQLTVRRIQPRIERRAIDPKLLGQRRALCLKRPDVEIDLRFGRQSGAVEGAAHLGHTGCAPSDLRLGCCITNVIPAIPPSCIPNRVASCGCIVSHSANSASRKAVKRASSCAKSASEPATAAAPSSANAAVLGSISAAMAVARLRENVRVIWVPVAGR
jgi:hypothetical protein